MTPDQAWWTAVIGTSLVVALGVAALRLRMWWVEREDQKEDQSLWHKCQAPMLPHKTIDGDWTSDVGQTWRLRHGGKWEYRQDPETDEDWDARQW